MCYWADGGHRYINHAHLVQWGHANSQRGVYNKSPRDERRNKMEKKPLFVQKEPFGFYDEVLAL